MTFRNILAQHLIVKFITKSLLIRRGNFTAISSDDLYQHTFSLRLYTSLVAVQHIINFHDAQHQDAVRERQVPYVLFKARVGVLYQI